MKYKVLIIDDEERLRGLMKRIISLEGYEVSEASSISSGRQALESHRPNIVLCDVKLQDGNGVDFTVEIKNRYPAVEVILLTAYGNIPDGVKAIKNGAFDYIVKGDDNDKILPLLSRAVEKVSLQERVIKLEKQLANQYSFDEIVGESPVLKNTIDLAKKVATTAAAVLLTGETGTGKEVFARAIHYASNRSQQGFIALNCSAFSKELLESELFGHKAGAFTGATKDKKGLIEEAKGGTLFLDEIGEMPLDMQPKLLRLLENGTYMRVGDTKELKADIRLIAATNRNLQNEIAAGHFRDDLYYRIAVFVIEMPALRQRTKDIPFLAKHYLKIYAHKTNKVITGISKEAMEALMKHEWKGNVRELKNVIERAVILEDSSMIEFTSLPYDLQYSGNENEQLPAYYLTTVERNHILKMLQYTNGNKAEAARLMNIGLATLYRKLDEYGLRSQ